ncbi:MAG: ABC transporter permease [Chloroflexota bacterium]
MKSILNLAWKEIIQLLRDRVLLIFLIVAPFSELILIAESTGSGVRGVKLAVWDQDQSQLSQDLVRTLDNSEAFTLVARAQSYEQIEQLINNGNAATALIIPPDFSRNALRAGAQASLNAVVDGTNVIVADYVLGDLQGAVNDVLSQVFAEAGLLLSVGGIDLKFENAFNPTLYVRWSTLSALLPFLTYQVVLIVAAVSFVRERELGTMEQLVVTPISRLDLMLGKGLTAFVVGIVNFSILYLTLTQVFRLPMRGDLILFTILGLLFIITEIGIGTLISIATSSQQQAILIVFLLAILEVTFSGILVPTENMPGFMQAAAAVSPLQHSIAMTRHVFLKGSTLPMMIDHVVMLIALTLASLGAASFLFARAEM